MPGPRARTATHRRDGDRALVDRPRRASAVLSVEERLQTMMADAIDGATVAQLDAVLRTLGHVWFSAMVSWVAGKTDGNRMRADLDSAAHLLLDAR